MARSEETVATVETVTVETVESVPESVSGGVGTKQPSDPADLFKRFFQPEKVTVIVEKVISETEQKHPQLGKFMRDLSAQMKEGLARVTQVSQDGGFQGLASGPLAQVFAPFTEVLSQFSRKRSSG